MVEVTYISPFNPSKTTYFYFSHSAKTSLLLSGYLPTEEDENIYINMYTREMARLTIRK